MTTARVVLWSTLAASAAVWLVAAPRPVSIKEWDVPTPDARPRRLALAPDGTIYYTDYARGYLGHFTPATAEFEEWPSPGGRASKPYGIAAAKDGVIWYSESGVEPNTLVSFDPAARAFASTPIPSGGGVVRNMVATPDGRLYLACSGVNKVAVADVPHRQDTTPVAANRR